MEIPVNEKNKLNIMMNAIIIISCILLFSFLSGFVLTVMYNIIPNKTIGIIALITVIIDLVLAISDAILMVNYKYNPFRTINGGKH